MGKHEKTILSAVLVTLLISGVANAADVWRGPYPISGTGVQDCGDSRATAAAWNICRQKAKDASELTGIPVSVVDIWKSFTRHDEEGPFWDHWHSCSFEGQAKCLFRLANAITADGLSADEAAEEPDGS